ncbi:MAG: hypothetical protein IKO72_13230 [Kiritimatiellae bacterium]|nr:hypothetical protein [Kiritimatiellia bacterium]
MNVNRSRMVRLFTSRKCLFTLVAMVAATLHAETNLFVNGDFEAGTNGWRYLPARFWRVKKGCGLDGSAGLVFEAKPGDKISWPCSDSIPVEAGLAYRFEAWMNSSGLKSKKGDLSLSFGADDANGHHLGYGGGAARRVIDNSVRKDGWHRVEGVTRVLPEKAVAGRFFLYSGDASGRVLIDKIVLRPVAANPVDHLCTSAYRNEAWEGDVAFSAAFCVNPLKNPVEALECVLEYVSTNGPATVRGTLSNAVATATLPVEALAYGRNEVALSVRRKDGTATLGRSCCLFTREYCPMPRKVTFDARHRTILDGRPFFPLGMYWGEVTAEDIAVYTNGAPFNCLMPYKRPDQARLDICQAAGLHVIYPLSGFFQDIGSARTPQKAAELDARYIRANVRRFRMHPSIMAWYLADEVPEHFEPILAARRAAVHEMDPDHPTWIVLDKPRDVRPLVRGFDVIGMDPYPVGNHGGPDRTEIGIAAGWAREAKKSTYGFKPMWQVPQAFDWGYYRPDETNRPSVHLPTYPELRSMTWQAIAAGANGLVFYSFFDALKRDKWPKERIADAWPNVCAVAKEVKAFEPVLLSDGVPPEIEDAPAEIAARAWLAGDRVHLLLANTVRSKVSGVLKVGGRSVKYELEPIDVRFDSWPVR